MQTNVGKRNCWVLFGVVEVAEEDGEALGESGFLICSGCKVVVDLLEDERVTHSGSAKHDIIAASFIKHAFGVFGTGDVAIADDRD